MTSRSDISRSRAGPAAQAERRARVLVVVSEAAGAGITMSDVATATQITKKQAKHCLAKWGREAAMGTDRLGGTTARWAVSDHLAALRKKEADRAATAREMALSKAAAWADVQAAKREAKKSREISAGLPAEGVLDSILTPRQTCVDAGQWKVTRAPGAASVFHLAEQS
jgi:hypothetical protein